MTRRDDLLVEDGDRPATMGPRARRCHGFCGGWRDPDTLGTTSGLHLNVHVVETAVDGRARVHGYWCAGGFDPEESLVLAFADGRSAPIRVIALDAPPDPWLARTRPHLRSVVVEAGEPVEPGTCIRPADGR